MITIKTRNRIVKYLLPFFILFWGAGKTFSQKAVRFESAGDYVQVRHSASLASSEFTIEFWLKVHESGNSNAANGEQTILDKRGSGAGYNFRLAETDFPLPIFAFVLPGGVNAHNAINHHIWYHIAVTQDQDTLKIYINGELAQAKANKYASSTTAPLRIGEFLGYPGQYLGLRGDIDELRIWRTARNQNQVQSTMHEKLSGSEAGLAAYWDFDSRSGNTITDLSPNGNDGTIYGNTSLVDSDAPIGFIPPEPPVGLRAFGSKQEIELVWKPGDHTVSAYHIYRENSTDLVPDSVNLLTTVFAPDSTYTDKCVIAGQNYVYQLRSVDEQQHISQPGQPTLSRTLSVESDYLTGVYYYPWYDPIYKHRWTGQFVRDYLVPEQSPWLDHYSSKDPLVIQQHLEWMEQYGVDFIVSSWWGQGTWEDIALRDYILPEIENAPVKFTIYYESAYLGIGDNGINIDNEKAEQLVSDFKYISETYFDHPNILKVDDKPAVFIYLSRIYTGNYKQAFAKVRSELQLNGYDLFLIGDEVGWGTPSASHMQFLDAVSPYIMVGSPKYRDFALERDFLADISIKVSEWEKVAHPEGKYIIPNVHPGFNNTAVNTSGFVVPRQIQAGAESTSLLEEYIKVMLPFVDPQLKMIMITSWNEWHEDSQIEPTIVAPPTNIDNSPSGSFYTHGFSYEGYGFKPLEIIRKHLASGLAVGIDGAPKDLPSGFTLSQNYPDPFNPSTTIEYNLSEVALVQLGIYNLLGQKVVELVNQKMKAGIHRIVWNAEGVSSGIYIVFLKINSHFLTKKVTLLK